MPVGTPISNSVVQGTLGGVRYNVVTDSGKHDLCIDYAAGNYQDNGCNRYINAAQHELDRLLGYKGDQAWLYKPLAIGQSLVTFNRARYISEVWIANTADAKRTRLSFLSLAELREAYNGVPLTEVDNGTPAYFAKLVPMLAPEQYAQTAETLTAAGLTDIDFLKYGNSYLLDGLTIMPPPSTAYTLEILGHWFAKELVNDSDVSVWTVNEQSLLEDATRMVIETKLHRNSEGVADWERSIGPRMRKLYNDLIAEQFAAMPQERMRMW